MINGQKIKSHLKTRIIATNGLIYLLNIREIFEYLAVMEYKFRYKT